MRELGSTWQNILAAGFSSAEDLLQFLNLPLDLASAAAQSSFKTKVPLGFAARMRQSDPSDPLLRQVLALPLEMDEQAGFLKDPLQELATNPIPGLIHKYASRVLLLMSGSCAIHCRYCFRRHFPYAGNQYAKSSWDLILGYIHQDKSIKEVILSGGDPLLVKDKSLQDLLKKLSEIPHLTTIRFHSRIPVVLPERIDAGFLAYFADLPLKKVMVLHSNHPNEINDAVGDACEKLRRAGCHILNQSVLLSGVNDDAAILAALSERLFDYGILPYYLHLLDKVQGAAHFDVDEKTALQIFKDLQTLLPGYLVPRLVREEAFTAHKTLI